MTTDESDDMTSHRHPPTCPTCGATMDASTDAYGTAAPGTGDVSVCFYCAGLAIYDGGGLREVTASERAELLADDRVTQVVGAVLAYRADKGDGGQ
jgi:hypothetical protein